jgi:glycosyltransferase involved in cell wall biosynthesis
MNILLITQEDFLAGSTFSVSFLARGLAARGHKVYVAARKDSLLESLITGSSATFLPITLRSRFDRSAMRQIRNWVHDLGIQIINAQSSKDRYLSIFAKRIYKLNVKVILTRRQYPMGDMGFLKTFFYSNGSDKIVVISHGLKEIFLQKGYASEDLEVIHNGIPPGRLQQWSPEQVEAIRKKYSIKESDIVVGCVSRLKKQEQIIRAMEMVNDPTVKLVFAGFPAGALDATIEESKIKNEIVYAGFVDKDEVLSFYKVFTMNVLSSTSEGFGLVLLESMAMGCPVIATNFGGIKDVVEDEVNGLLFDDYDVAKLAEQIKRVLVDKSLRERLIGNGYKTVNEKFTMEKTITNWERFFERMIEQK